MSKDISVHGNVEKYFYKFHFTRRELDILYFLTEEIQNNEIAKRLSISDSTIKCHLNNIYKKTGNSNRNELIKYCINNKHIIEKYKKRYERI